MRHRVSSLQYGSYKSTGGERLTNEKRNFMLIVTSKILMHTIKPLKEPSTDKNVFVYFYAKMLKICT